MKKSDPAPWMMGQCTSQLCCILALPNPEHWLLITVIGGTEGEDLDLSGKVKWYALLSQNFLLALS